MPTVEDFKQKYSSAFAVMGKGGVRLDHLHVDGDKLVITGAACSEDLRNRIWNEIKAVDTSYGDLNCQIDIDASLPAPPPEEQSYTVVGGDTLSKIARQFYGDAAMYMKIAEANGLADPNKINVGQKLSFPACWQAGF